MGLMRNLPVRHFRMGSMTACSLRGIDHRAIHATTDRDSVTCRNCRRWLTRSQALRPVMKNVTPEN